MIEDESEPSFCPEFNFSSTSSIFSDDYGSAKSGQLQRRQSVSLHNMSSTPYIQQTSNPAHNRSSSQCTIDTIRKTKRSRYDHIESKVKQNLIESKRQQVAMKERKRRERQFLKVKDYDTNEEVKTESDQIDIKLLSVQFMTLEEKYSETQNKIDSLQLELDKIKSEGGKSVPFVTPRMMNKRNNIQTSLMKTLLYNSSTSGHCHNSNTPRTCMSMFEGDSTCMTLDVADVLPTEEITQLNNEQLSVNTAVIRDNPFLIQTLSPASTTSYHSESPLLMNYTEHRTSKNRFRNFLYKFLRCPKVQGMKRHKIYNCCVRFKNRVYPDSLPKVVIISPSDHNSDSGNHSEEQFNRMFQKVHRNNWIDYSSYPNQELLLEQLTQCADELTSKLNAFKTLTAEYLNKKSD